MVSSRKFSFETMVARIRTAAEMTVVMLGSGLMALIYTVPAPILFQVDREYGPWIAQGMGNLPSLGIIIGGPMSGYLGRRLGTRSALLLGLLSYSILGPCAIAIRNPYLLLASRFALGFAAALGVSTTVVILSSRYADSTRARMLGLQGGIAGFLGLATLVLSGQIATQHTWRTAFWIYLFGGLLLGLAFFGAGSNVAMSGSAPADSNATWRTLRTHWRLLLVVSLLYCASFSTGLQLSFKLGEHGILSPTTQSYVILGASLLNALGSAAYGLLAAALSDLGIRTLLLSLMAIGSLIVGVGTTAGVIGLGGSLMGLGGGLVGPNLLSKALARVSPQDRGSVTGLFFSSIFVGEFLNPVIMQPLRSSFGTDGAFLALGGALALAALATLIARRAFAR